MSTKLGTLTLDLVAKIGNFVEPINQAEKKAKGASKTITDSFTVSNIAVTALGAAFAGVTVGGLAAFTSKIIDTANEIKKLSQLSNTSTFDFQFYAKGAETAGISMESFADKMKDMQDRIGDFQQTGGGPLADFFENIAPLVGITIQQFQKLSGPDALQLFYDSLVKVGATQNDMKFYMESIISDSSLLIPLLENGGEGFKKWGQAASDAGAIMSNEMIDKLALAKENMQMLNLQVEGVQVSLINGFTPAIQTVANNLDVVAVAIGTVAVVMTAKAAPAFIVGAVEATRYQLALARMAAQAAGTTTTLTVLGGVARGALGLLGGPVGLALTVAATAGAYLLFRDNTKESTVSLRENNETVEEAIKKYGELDKIKRAAQLVEEREKLEDLTSAYDNANSKLISYTLKVVRNAEMTSDQAKAFSKLVMDYKSGKITLEQLSDSISKSTALSSDEKDAFIKKAASVRDASTEVGKHKNLVLQMIDRDKQFIRNNDDVTNAIDRRTTAISRLSKKEQDVYNSIGQSVQRESYINNNMAQGKSREWAEYFADKRSEASIPYTEKLTEHMYLQFETGYKLQQQIEKREETEKKIAEGQKKKAEFAEKNYSYTKSELAMLERVAKISSENNLNGIGAKYGIPENLLAAVMAQESKGVVNAKSESGAIGPFQTTGVYRKQYGMSVADSYDVKKAADIAAKDLAKSFEVFGNWTDAVTAYNAGVGGTKSLNSRGFTTSDAKTKEAKGYAPLVDKWLTGLNGSSTKGSGLTGKEAVASIKELGEYWENAEQLRKESLERQKTVSEMYLSEGQRLFAENKGAKKEIQEAFVNNPEAIDRYLKLQEIAYQKDLVEFKKAQEQKRVATYEAFYNPLAEMQMIGMNATAQATLSPMEYQKWQVGSEQQAGYSQLGDSFLSAQKAINDNELLTETERYAQLETVYEQYLQAKSALSVQYAKEEDDLRKQQKMQQLDLWGSVLSQAQNTFAQLTQSVQNSAGEQSGIYKTMFAMQKAFTIASSMAAAYTAYAQAFADPSAMTLPQKFAGGAAVMSALMPAITTISSLSLDGMAHDGIDNVPKEGTWLLDKGERVVDSRTNADLKNYLASGRGSGGDTTIQVNVTDSGVSTQSSNGEKKLLGDMIGNAVRAVIRQEKRQGGLLAK